MKSILQKIGVVRTKDLEFSLSKSEFLNILKRNIDDINSGPTIFRKSEHLYKGKIYHHEFSIRENHNVFDSTHNDAKLEGEIEEREDKVIIHLKSSGVTTRNIAFFVGGLLFLLLMPVTLTSQLDESGSWITFLPFIIMPPIFMYVPIHFGRLSSAKMLYNFEREMFYMVEKNKTTTNPAI